jgi:hypothetical protein
MCCHASGDCNNLQTHAFRISNLIYINFLISDKNITFPVETGKIFTLSLQKFMIKVPFWQITVRSVKNNCQWVI